MSTEDKIHFEVFEDIVNLINQADEADRAVIFEKFREFSHDMRTVTGLIEGASKLLIRELAEWEGAEDVQDLFDIIQGNANRGKLIVEDFRKTIGEGIELGE